MLRLPLLLLLLSVGSQVLGQKREVSVGLLVQSTLKQVLVSSGQSRFTAIDNKGGEHVIEAKDALRISIANGQLQAKSLTSSFSSGSQLTLRAGEGQTMRLGTLGKHPVEHDHTGTLVITREGDHLKLVNRVPMEDYVAGVVRSEAGENKTPEYYKLQAVICRTYVLTNIRKHLAEGYNVCDGTHCQVFKGRCRYEPVNAAVAATRDMVVVDPDIRLIHSTFHSNCGGETMNAEDIWSKSESYLVSTVDPYCADAPHASWTKTMERTKWLDYLHKSYGLDLKDTLAVHNATRFQPQCRSSILYGTGVTIPLGQVRSDLKLRSAYFNVWPSGDKVILDGRGFGHGVGLCQEGAMNMAAKGFSYTDILHHYFAGVHLVDLRNLDFFRDEGR